MSYCITLLSKQSSNHSNQSINQLTLFINRSYCIYCIFRILPGDERHNLSTPFVVSTEDNFGKDEEIGSVVRSRVDGITDLK